MRRRLSAALACAFVAACATLTGCGAASVAPAATAPAAPAAQLIAGPMLGHSAGRAVLVWAQLDGPGAVAVHATPLDEAEAVEVTSPAVMARAEDGFAVTVEVGGLEPGVRYDYDVLVDGAVVSDAPYQVLRTAPLWQWRGDPPAFTVAFGSCNYVNEAAYDRPGTPYGAGYEIFDVIEDLSPDLMLWLGDNTYLREADWTSAWGIRARFAHDRALAESAELLASTHNYATWDDHDFGPNNSSRSWVFRDAVRDVFEDFWANPTYGRDGQGIYTSFAWGDAEFFLLDGRWFRDATGDGVDAPAMFGDEQLAWLLDGLTASTATWRVVVSGSQMMNDAAFYEGWAQHPDERSRFLDQVVARRIPGLVFLSGDRHHAELIRRDVEGLYPVYDVTSSPLTAGVGDARYELDNPMRVDGTLTLERNVGSLSFDGAWQDRTLTIRIHSADGGVRWEHRIHQSELVPPAAAEPE